MSTNIMVRCSQCGSELNVSLDSRLDRIMVDPCPKCVRAASQHGYELGQAEAG